MFISDRERKRNMKPILYIVIPCYNEEKVLPITAPMFLKKIEELEKNEKISGESRVMFVDDGSGDRTWEIISDLAQKDSRYIGIGLSRNRGHQNALLAGLLEAKNMCDITISIDCDGQDDINAMDKMVDAYLGGADIVYGVRSDRKSDSFFKRTTAQCFYRLMNRLGAETVYNHADYRLMSKRVLDEFENFKEVNLFLRGMVPLVGFNSSSVYYERRGRLAGKSHYPLKKMTAFAIDGITSFSVKPIKIISGVGSVVSVMSFVFLVYSVIMLCMKRENSLILVLASVVCLLLGMLMVSLGIVGVYIGKIYMEAKARPRFIVGRRTFKEGGTESAASEK
ncbi:MAG: glycosyltransferase family 2 protein [Acutalibacteraceae bacterium]